MVQERHTVPLKNGRKSSPRALSNGDIAVDHEWPLSP